MTVFYRFQDSGLDDYNKLNNYVQMGFRPGFAIQARELTQMQTIMQAQLTAFARRFLKNGSATDPVNQVIVQGSGEDWSATLTSGYYYVEPYLKDVGYFVYNSSALTIPNINAPADGTVYGYIQWEEVQVNPDGEEHLGGGGYATVKVDETLKDNAQGYSNWMAPGASRYQINIIGAGWYLDDGTINLPANAAIVFYIEDGIPKYYDTGDVIPT